jgi:tellurite resistance protein
MEFLGFILMFVGIVAFRWLLGAGAATASAAANAAIGKGSFSENMELNFKGMGPLEIRFNDTHMGDSGDGPLVKEIQGRGLFPILRNTRIGFITSVFDSTEEQFQPVVSALEVFQEPETVIYQHLIEAGQAEPNQGFVSWVRLGVVIPAILRPPHGGTRTLTAALRMVNLDDPPPISLGFHDPEHPGLIWQAVLSFEHTFDEKGYQEAAEHRDEARGLAVTLGMAVAMADGSLDNAEGNTLKEWILKAVSPFSGERQSELKELYNEAMREAHGKAKRGDLSLTHVTARLNEIAERSMKYEAVELCFDVMAADGIADGEELRTVHKVADALGLDFDEIERMRDQKIIALDSRVSDEVDIETLLGIEDDWDPERMRKHLTAEFQKWNDRLNTLDEGEERDNAQAMLGRIAEARQKYD